MKPDATRTGLETAEYRTITVEVAPGPGGSPYDPNNTPGMFVRTADGISMVPAEAHADVLFKAWQLAEIDPNLP